MLKFGLEKEYFCLDEQGVPTVAPSDIPHDGCGWLIEARGEAADSIDKAVFLLLAEERRIRMLLEQIPTRIITMGDADFMAVPRGVKLRARRRYEKGLLRFNNLYGRAPTKRDTAGLHISVTRPRTAWSSKTDTAFQQTYHELWDFASFVSHLDKAFKEEIRDAKRVPGFYEIKADGRFEYRSLPASADLEKVMVEVDRWFERIVSMRTV